MGRKCYEDDGFLSFHQNDKLFFVNFFFTLYKKTFCVLLPRLLPISFEENKKINKVLCVVYKYQNQYFIKLFAILTKKNFSSSIVTICMLCKTYRKTIIELYVRVQYMHKSSIAKTTLLVTPYNFLSLKKEQKCIFQDVRQHE